MSAGVPERDFLFLRGDTIPPIKDVDCEQNPEQAKREIQRATRDWVKSLSPEQKRSYRSVRKTIYQILGLPPRYGLGIRSHLQSIREDETKVHELGIRSCLLTAGMYGISGTPEDIVKNIKGYGRKANGVIHYIQKEILQDPFVTFEMANEITQADTPAELLLISYDETYPEKTRFEAIRKIALMRLDLGNDRKRIDNKSSAQFDKFVAFLDKYVWSKKHKTSETKTRRILSTHDMTDYGCTRVQILDDLPEEIQPNQRITPMGRRFFTVVRTDDKPGEDIEAYMPMREKDDISQVIKNLRKRTENPNEAYEDEVGAMIIVDNSHHLGFFDQRLTQGATEANSLVMNEEGSDSMSNGNYIDGHPGSSHELKMLKSPVRVAGARAEIMALLLKDYIDYLYKDGVAHDEFEVNRFFKSGSAELLFPPNIYNYNPEKSHRRIIQAMRMRKRLEMSWYEI